VLTALIFFPLLLLHLRLLKVDTKEERQTVSKEGKAFLYLASGKTLYFFTSLIPGRNNAVAIQHLFYRIEFWAS
jgi:hypothetical protein